MGTILTCQVQKVVNKINGDQCGRPAICEWEYGRNGPRLKMCKKHDREMKNTLHFQSLQPETKIDLTFFVRFEL